jgi:predicted permease
MFDTLKQDFRYSLRGLLARPGFLMAAVLTLALGIGANTAIFSVVNGLLLKPLPYKDGERLVLVHNTYPKMGLDDAGTSIPDYFDRREQAPALDDLAIYTGESLNLAAEGTPQRLVGLRASASLFSTLQANAAIGRVFDAESEIPGQDKVAVLSHDLWQSQFAGDPGVVGRDVRLNGENFRVIGVMPADFVFPNRNTQLWIPFAFTPEQKSDDERGNEYSETVGRLAPGATIDQLNAQMDGIVARNADRIAGLDDPRAAGYADFMRNGGFFGRAMPLREQWVGDVRPVLWLLQAVVGFVLLIACANVANLMLTRVSSRQKELSVRSALGASRRRIIRQLLIESVLLALVGAVAGIAIAFVCLQLLDALNITQSPLRSEIGIDGPVLAFTLGVSVFTGLVFGLFPAFAQSGDKTYEGLKEGGRGNTGGRAARMTRSTLVVVQIALCVTLLVGAGLLVKSFNRLQNESPGFSRDGLLTVRMDLPESRYRDDATIARFYERALTEIRAIPGVTQAGYISNLPFGQSTWQSSYSIEGREQSPEESSPHGFARVADETFFKALDIPLLAGRYFTESDTADSQRVIIIDELLAKKYFKDVNPIGRRIRSSGPEEENPWWTIVGVVGTVKHGNLASDMTKEAYYFPYRQFYYTRFGQRGGFFTIKSDLPTGSLVEPVRAAVLRVDPEQPLYDIKTLDDRIALSLQGRRAPMLLLVLFAGVALLLSAVGIYGVLAYAVEQRTGELGVRMAIGAQRGDVVRMVLGQGGRIAAIGIGAGLVGALALGGFLSTQLFGVSRFDPLTFALVVIVLAAVAFFACWLPARRASRVSPIVALRHE